MLYNEDNSCPFFSLIQYIHLHCFTKDSMIHKDAIYSSPNETQERILQTNCCYKTIVYLLAVWQNLTLTNIKLIYEIDSPQTLGHQWLFVTYSSVSKSSSPI